MLKFRSVAAVILLPLVTFGFYSLYWTVRTKTELNLSGAKIPTAWLIIIPFVNIYWLWKFCEGTQVVTKGKLDTILAFIVMFLLGSIGNGIVQYYLNGIITEKAKASA